MRVLMKLGLLPIALVTPPVMAAGMFTAAVESETLGGSGHTSSKFDPDHCNWYCHNQDCRHKAKLPEVLVGNDGAFGKTIKVLSESGKATGIGYQGMNILVFCLIWPAVTYFFYMIAIIRAIWNLL